MPASQVSANPVAARLPASQAAPKRYEPSAIRPVKKGQEPDHYERGDPEVYVEDNYDPNDTGDVGYNSPQEIDLANMEKDVENEDLLAIT